MKKGKKNQNLRIKMIRQDWQGKKYYLLFDSYIWIESNASRGRRTNCRCFCGYFDQLLVVSSKRKKFLEIEYFYILDEMYLNTFYFDRTIIYMPNSLRVLCLTNLFCWMSLVCYSLYFTDFVGEAVFRGNPSVST